MAVEICDTVAHLRRLERARAARGQARQAALEEVLPLARAVLRRRGAGVVYLFGSIATGGAAADSDLDLATEGLPGDAYFAALGELLRTLPCDVDLVRLEEAPESLRERVCSEGRRL